MFSYCRGERGCGPGEMPGVIAVTMTSPQNCGLSGGCRPNYFDWHGPTHLPPGENAAFGHPITPPSLSTSSRGGRVDLSPNESAQGRYQNPPWLEHVPFRGPGICPTLGTYIQPSSRRFGVVFTFTIDHSSPRPLAGSVLHRPDMISLRIPGGACHTPQPCVYHARQTLPNKTLPFRPSLGRYGAGE